MPCLLQRYALPQLLLYFLEVRPRQRVSPQGCQNVRHCHPLPANGSRHGIQRCSQFLKQLCLPISGTQLRCKDPKGRRRDEGRSQQLTRHSAAT